MPIPPSLFEMFDHKVAAPRFRPRCNPPFVPLTFTAVSEPDMHVPQPSRAEFLSAALDPKPKPKGRDFRRAKAFWEANKYRPDFIAEVLDAGLRAAGAVRLWKSEALQRIRAGSASSWRGP